MSLDMDAFAKNIWLIDSPEMPETLGFKYPLRMVVIRLSDGGLWLWSPVKMTQAIANEVRALGDVKFLVSPNRYHHLHIGEWQAAYPNAKLVAAPGLAPKRPDLRVDHELSEGWAPWGNDIEHVIFWGNKLAQEAVFFHRASGTVVFCDILQRIPTDLLSGWRLLVARLDRMVGDEPQVPRKFRLAFRDKSALRSAVERVEQWPASAVLIAHGAPVTVNAQAFLKRAFSWVK